MIGERKVDTLEAIYLRLARHSIVHRILCGDFNTPEFVLPTGKPEPFRTRRVSQKQRDRQAAAELNVLTGLAEFGLSTVVGPNTSIADAWSYQEKNRIPEWRYQHFGLTQEDAQRKRFDHVFASRGLKVVCWRYMTDWLLERRSDHAAIVVRLDPNGDEPADRP